MLSHSVMSDSVTPWIVTHQAPLSMGILQARILGWVAVSPSRGIFLTQGLHLHFLHLLRWQADSLPLNHLGSPISRHTSYCYLHSEATG